MDAVDDRVPAERAEILANPPDILLTNYVMLHLLLTRLDEREWLITAAEDLRFLVLDELHTHRTGLTPDVGLLVCRLCEHPDLFYTVRCAPNRTGQLRGD